MGILGWHSGGPAYAVALCQLLCPVAQLACVDDVVLLGGPGPDGAKAPTRSMVAIPHVDLQGHVV